MIKIEIFTISNGKTKRKTLNSWWCYALLKCVMLKHIKIFFKGIGKLSLIDGQHTCILIYNFTIQLEYSKQNLKNAQYFPKANIVGLHTC